MNYGQEKYPDGFRWSALAERGRMVIRSTKGAADTFTTLRFIGLWLRSKRSPRVISMSRPNMSKACVALKALKCSMIQNEEVEASHFLEELEDCLKRGDAGVVMVRLVIRSPEGGNIEGGCLCRSEDQKDAVDVFPLPSNQARSSPFESVTSEEAYENPRSQMAPRVFFCFSLKN